MQKKLTSLLRIYKSEREVQGFLSLDRMERTIAKNLFVKRAMALRGCTRAWASSSHTHFK